MPRKNEIDYLEEIASKTGSATITGPVTVTNEVEIKNAENNPIPVSDNGGSLTVDGTVDLGPNSLAALESIQVEFPSTQNVSVQNTSLAVTGTFFQATQPVSATALPLPTGASSETTLSAVNTKIPSNLTVSSTRLLVDGSGVTQPVSLATAPTTPVTGTFWQATQPVSLATAPTTPVTGTFWQATQPVSATTLPLPTGASSETTLSAVNTKIPSNLTVSSTRLLVDGSGVTQPVSIASAPVTPVTDNGGSLTVDGTITAAQTTAANLNATVVGSGSFTAAQATATNLKTQAETYQGGTAVGSANPLQVTLANTAANAIAVKVDGSGVTQPTRETQPTGDYVINTSSLAAFSASGSALQSASFDAGANADYVVITLSGAGSAGAFYYDLSTNNSTWDLGTTSQGFATYYDLPATSATDTYSYKTVTAASLFGSTRSVFAGRFIVPLTQLMPGIGSITTYRYIRLNLPASNGGWRYRFASYKSVDAVTPASQPGNPSTTRVAGRVDVGFVSNLPALPTGTNTIGSVNVLGGNTTAIKVDVAPLSLTQNIVALSDTVANGNRSALSSRPTRRFLLIQNLSDTAMNINFGADASSSTMLLPANGGGVEFSGPYVPTSEVRIFCTATPKAYYILEAYST